MEKVLPSHSLDFRGTCDFRAWVGLKLSSDRTPENITVLLIILNGNSSGNKKNATSHLIVYIIFVVGIPGNDVSVLVCTDAMSRGLDLPNVAHGKPPPAHFVIVYHTVSLLST